MHLDPAPSRPLQVAQALPSPVDDLVHILPEGKESRQGAERCRNVMELETLHLQFDSVIVLAAPTAADIVQVVEAGI